MEMDSYFKIIIKGLRGGSKLLVEGGSHEPSLQLPPHANHVPLKVEGVYDQHGVGGVKNAAVEKSRWTPPLADPYWFFEISLSICIS